MQLESDVIHRGLVHQDPIVRRICGYWLNDKCSRLSVRTDDIVDAYSKWGLDAVYHIEVRACDDRLVDWLLNQSATDFGESSFNDFRFHLVWNWLRNANIDLVRARLPDIRNAVADWHGRHTSEHMQLSIVSEIEARLATFDLGPDRCWQQVLQRCRQIDRDDGQEYNHEQFWATVREMERYQECASQANIASELITILKEDDQLTMRIEIAAMIQMAERMHLEEAAPYAIQLFKLDWDHLNQVIGSYFQENCSERLQQLVSEGFQDRVWYEQLFLEPVFSADHSPVAAGHLRKQLADECSMVCQERLSTLAQAVAFQFCTEDIETLDELYQANRDDPEFAQVAETLHTLIVLGELNDSRDSTWSQAQETVQELHTLSLRMPRATQPAFADEIPEPNDRRSDRLDNNTIRSATLDRVGRNDPCPCGSGKKYKKCCLQ